MFFFVTTILCGNEQCIGEVQNVMTGDQSLEGIVYLFINFGNFSWINQDLINTHKAAMKSVNRFRALIFKNIQENTLKRFFYTTLHDKIIEDYTSYKNAHWKEYSNVSYDLVEMKKHQTFILASDKNGEKYNCRRPFRISKDDKYRTLYYLTVANEHFIDKLCLNSAGDGYMQYKKNSIILYDSINNLVTTLIMMGPVHKCYKADTDHLLAKAKLRA